MYENFLERKGCILADDMGLGKTVQVTLYQLSKNIVDICLPWHTCNEKAIKTGCDCGSSDPNGVLEDRN